MTDTIMFEISGQVARIVLNNPEKHNSLGAQELAAVQACIEQVAADSELRVLVITGAGDKTFCAGAALNQLGAGRISGDLFQATTDKLAQLKIPTLCALNGDVFGGGVELALSCDFRIGVQGTRMRVPAAQIGLCYPPGGIKRFVERLGINLANRILVAAEEFDAEAMLQIGFLDHLVAREALLTRTDELATSLAALAPLAVQAMKQILQQAAAGGIDLELAQSLAQICSESEDLQEGFAAQRARRTPSFNGS
ncbi:MAG: enoyl-CoA hydratase/isomerase family protein [Gammaproteobacteria bacterium]|nr:enoyl-CoA hydratase/isomerase family protein [Gammaproteobacteria bacterium]